MDLSILIPSIPERQERLSLLFNKLQGQIDRLPVEKAIEIIVYTDNKVISIGEKRERLKNLAGGKYFCFLDDDDDIAEDYIEEIWNVAKSSRVDVIYFDTQAIIDGQIGLISVDHKNPENEQFKPGGETLRKPCHVNCWKTKKFKKFKFSNKMYGEDFDFINQCYPFMKTGHKIDKVLHYYIFDSAITRAF